jgi:hypothetical protein
MSGSETPDAVRFPVIEPKGPVTHPLTIEERYHSLATLYKHQYFATYRHIARQTSWEVANRIADDMAAESIPMLAEGFKRAYGLAGTGAALVAQVHVTEMLVEGSDVHTLTETADEAEYEVVCPWGAAIASGRFEGAEEIADGLCNRGCWGFMQRVADTVSDDLDVDRRTWMGDGASSCHFCVSRK